MRNFLITIAILLLVSSNAFAVGKVLAPVNNQSAQPIAGRGANGDAIPIFADDAGNIGVSSIDQSGVTLNFKTTITLAGVGDRTQFASHVVHHCYFEAPVNNASYVYIGGSTVTNSSGANEGVFLVQGEKSPQMSMANTNEYYAAADTANDRIITLCK